jgi:hypothetical protein
MTGRCKCRNIAVAGLMGSDTRPRGRLGSPSSRTVKMRCWSGRRAGSCFSPTPNPRGTGNDVASLGEPRGRNYAPSASRTQHMRPSLVQTPLGFCPHVSSLLFASAPPFPLVLHYASAFTSGHITAEASLAKILPCWSACWPADVWNGLLRYFARAPPLFIPLPRDVEHGGLCPCAIAQPSRATALTVPCHPVSPLP